MNLNKFTQKSQEAISEAQNISIRFENQYVDVEHLALALLEQEEGLVPSLLEKLNCNPQAFLKALEEQIAKLPRVTQSGGQAGQIYVTPRLNTVLVKALDMAKKMQDEYVSVEHLFLVMLAL